MVVVLLVAGGAFAVTNFLNSSGTQPATALPGNAIGYVRIDVNPSGDQKLKAYEFLRRFPAVADKIGNEDEDPRKTFFEAVAEDDECIAKIDYAKDIEPWIGDRLGVAVLPTEGRDEPEVVIALEVKDQEAAKDGMDKIAACEDSEAGVAFTGDYAVLAETKAAAEKSAKAAESSPLAEAEQFKSDMDAVGDQGIASFWFDGDAIAKLTGEQAGIGAVSPKQGRLVGAVKFDSRYIELTGLQRGGPTFPANAASVATGNLPDSTAAALSIGGAGDLVKKSWPQLQKALDQSGMGGEFDTMIRQAEQQLGVELPDDLVTLLGQDTTVAVDQEGLDSLSGGSGMPKVGLRFTTDVAKAKPVLDKLLDTANQMMAAQTGSSQLQLGRADGNGQLAVGSTQEYADALVAGGKLGESEAFQLAIPEADKAQFALFVDLDKLEKLYLQTMKGEEKDNLEKLQAVGLSCGRDEDGSRFSFRVVAN
ncbi:MAG TPA: DUF3352 domain-containing protein [Actinopolymorphaceae bacterium]